jgi:hypothetical protein
MALENFMVILKFGAMLIVLPLLIDQLLSRYVSLGDFTLP